MEKFLESDVQVYTVWVGGIEISPELSSIESAKDIADDWRRMGYDDVVIGSYFRKEQ